MKILFSFILLTNIFLLLWEFREGAFNAERHNSKQATTILGRESILLISEVKKEILTPAAANYKPENDGYSTPQTNVIRAIENIPVQAVRHSPTAEPRPADSAIIYLP
jgi:hypothetical protein